MQRTGSTSLLPLVKTCVQLLRLSHIASHHAHEFSAATDRMMSTPMSRAKKMYWAPWMARLTGQRYQERRKRRLSTCTCMIQYASQSGWDPYNRSSLKKCDIIMTIELYASHLLMHQADPALHTLAQCTRPAQSWAHAQCPKRAERERSS